MDFNSLRKKNCEPKVSILYPVVCDFQKQNRMLGYRFKNLQKNYSVAYGFFILCDLHLCINNEYWVGTYFHYFFPTKLLWLFTGNALIYDWGFLCVFSSPLQDSVYRCPRPICPWKFFLGSCVPCTIHRIICPSVMRPIHMLDNSSPCVSPGWSKCPPIFRDIFNIGTIFWEVQGRYTVCCLHYFLLGQVTIHVQMEI